MTSVHETMTLPAETTHEESHRSQFATKVVAGLAPARISAFYLLIVIVIVFSIAAPNSFPTVATVEQILNSYSITALAALALVIPLSAGVFDVSVPYTMTFSGIVSSYLIVHTGTPVWVAISAGILVGLVIGAANSIIVVGLGIDSLIATLAMGAVIDALSTMLTNSTPITAIVLSEGFSKFGQASVGSVTIPVFYMIAIAIAIWYVLEHTATGRRLVAVGFNLRAARLAGVRADRLRIYSLLTSGLIAAFAGVVLASTIASGSPGVGTPYLLPAFAGVFLGATQFKQGRFNAFGTLLAVMMIGAGVTGLQLVNAKAWAGDLFTGVVLIAALAITRREQRMQGAGKHRRRKPLATSMEMAEAGTPNA